MAVQESTESSVVPLQLSQAIQVTWESVLISGMAILALISRLWALGTRVMSHDESLHVYYSWLLSTGQCI